MKFDKFVKQLNSSKPLLAVLVDPDKFNPEVIRLSNENKVNCFLVGGSGLKTNNISQVITEIKKISKIPVVLFPGDETQLTKQADGLLLLSLLSGRNPEYLIEKHVRAAPLIHKLKLSHLPTAYLLLEGGNTSTTQKITGTTPLSSQSKIIFTSLAGEQLGFKAIYLEAGSGAKKTISAGLIKKIKKTISIPLIVGGGIDSEKKATELISAGANMIVVGNALEKNSALIHEISKAFK
ncbi:MAG: Geranylgeranylglyceryl phosphate synthase [Bacteroidetes bacterium]|jgi:putative glycerol-1-phosphate prenyltransferase|nr:Geranylgeranylglyceryl phosphate synthase [Bacteroidota bacterium]